MGHAERIVPMIGEVLGEAGLIASDLDVIAVANGPGSFTGTRIAVAAARALALASRARIVALSSLAVMAEAAALELAGEATYSGSDRDLVVVVDARRDEVYAQAFRWRAGGGAEASSAPIVTNVEAAAALGGGRSVVFCGSGAAAVAALAAQRGRDAVARIPELLPDAKHLLRLAMRVEPATEPVKPLYLRPADAKPQVGKSIERVRP